MRLQTFAIGIMVFSVVIITMASAMTSFIDSYNPDAADVNLQRFNQTDRVNELVVTLKNDLQDKNQTFTVVDTFNAFVKTGFTGARLIFALLPAATDISESVQSVIQINSVLMFGLISILTALIGFTLISAILKWRS